MSSVSITRCLSELRMTSALRAIAAALAVSSTSAQMTAGTNFYALQAIDIDGNLVDFSQYMGSVSLVVNVATY
jgi:hypothetical protein